MKCPICLREGGSRYRPFCSRRCADIDLGRWFDGSYSMPLDFGREFNADNGTCDESPPDKKSGMDRPKRLS